MTPRRLRLAALTFAANLALTSLGSATEASGGESDSGLKILNSDFVRVVYPHDLALAGTDATVEISYQVHPDGGATAVRLTRASHPDAAAAVLASLDTMVFETAKAEGKPVLSGPQTLSINLRQTQLAGDLTFLSVIRNPAAVVTPAREVDGGLKPTRLVPAVFPSSLRGSGLKQGRAVLEFYVDPAGIVRLPKILSATDPALGWSAATAALTWRFDPPLKGGQPAIVKVTGLPVILTAPTVERPSTTASASRQAEIYVESMSSLWNPQLKVNAEVKGSLPQRILVDLNEDGTLSRVYTISINFTNTPSILSKLVLDPHTHPPARISFYAGGAVETQGTGLEKR